MRLTEEDALSRLATHDHAILCTSNHERGIDAVPVCFAISGNDVGVPIDSVKPKTSLRLQRERNLEEDPRATLLVEHWDPVDWSQLWWVVVNLRWQPDTVDQTTTLSGLLANRYPQYREQPFVRVLVLQIIGVSGWAALPNLS